MLSVCVCTYNRAQSLARTLDTLVAQIGVNWANVEVVVIDNNCTDDTADVVAAAAARLPVRRVIEQAQGLANARNRALAVSRGRWIIFTDDDVLLERDWLRSYTEAFDAFPKASFAAGRIVPLWKQGRPGWFKGERLDLMNGVLGWYDIGTDVRAMTLAPIRSRSGRILQCAEHSSKVSVYLNQASACTARSLGEVKRRNSSSARRRPAPKASMSGARSVTIRLKRIGSLSRPSIVTVWLVDAPTG